MNGPDILYLVGLGALLAVTVLMIRRGGGRKPDNDANKSNIGGGPGDGGGHD